MTTHDEFLFSLARSCATSTGSSLNEMRGRCKDAKTVKAREQFAYRGNNLGYSFPTLGRFLHKDHSSMVLAYHRYAKANDLEPQGINEPV